MVYVIIGLFFIFVIMFLFAACKVAKDSDDMSEEYYRQLLEKEQKQWK